MVESVAAFISYAVPIQLRIPNTATSEKAVPVVESETTNLQKGRVGFCYGDHPDNMGGNLSAPRRRATSAFGTRVIAM